MVYTHVKSFTIVKNRKCGQVTSHCRKARPYRADLSMFLNVPVVTVKSEITVSGRLFQTVGETWQKARLEKFRTDLFRSLASSGNSNYSTSMYGYVIRHNIEQLGGCLFWLTMNVLFLDWIFRSTAEVMMPRKIRLELVVETFRLLCRDSVSEHGHEVRQFWVAESQLYEQTSSVTDRGGGTTHPIVH